MEFEYDDGGRKAAGWKAERMGDCVTCAIAIATRLPYQTVYDDLNRLGKMERTGKRKRGEIFGPKRSV